MMNKKTSKIRRKGAIVTSVLVQNPALCGSVVNGMFASSRTMAIS
jgi:hypothetical protein